MLVDEACLTAVDAFPKTYRRSLPTCLRLAFDPKVGRWQGRAQLSDHTSEALTLSIKVSLISILAIGVSALSESFLASLTLLAGNEPKPGAVLLTDADAAPRRATLIYKRA